MTTAREPWCDARAQAWAAARTLAFTPRCSGYCIGTANAATLVEDLACPVHGIAAQERAEDIFPDRQAWLDSLAEASHSQERQA